MANLANVHFFLSQVHEAIANKRSAKLRCGDIALIIDYKIDWLPSVELCILDDESHPISEDKIDDSYALFITELNTPGAQVYTCGMDGTYHLNSAANMIRYNYWKENPFGLCVRLPHESIYYHKCPYDNTYRRGFKHVKTLRYEVARATSYRDSEQIALSTLYLDIMNMFLHGNPVDIHERERAYIIHIFGKDVGKIVNEYAAF